MREISECRVGRDGIGDAYRAVKCEESAAFMAEIKSVCEKHGLVLVPQSSNYEISFHTPMRVVPLTKELQEEIDGSWVCFKGV